MRTSRKFLVLFLLVCLGLQGGSVFNVEAGETIFGRITADGSPDPDDTAAETCLKAVNVTDAEESFSVSCGDTAGGTVKFVSGTQVASALNLDIGEGNFFSVTGTTQINNIATADTYAGRLIVLTFGASLTVGDRVDGGNLELSGAFSATANDTLILYCFDGTLWHELGEEVN